MTERLFRTLWVEAGDRVATKCGKRLRDAVLARSTQNTVLDKEDEWVMVNESGDEVGTLSGGVDGWDARCYKVKRDVRFTLRTSPAAAARAFQGCCHCHLLTSWRVVWATDQHEC